MEKPKFYDEAPVIGVNNSPLPSGEYICEIKKAALQKASTSENILFVLLLDIFEGEQKGYFQDRFDKDTRQDKKWGCILRTIYEDKTGNAEKAKNNAGRLKGIITNINNSNDGYTFDWNDENNLEKLKGKLVGAIFGAEEYTAKDGSTKLVTKIRSLKDKNSVKNDEQKKPKVKLLDGSFVDYEEYMQKKNNSKEKTDSYITIEDDDLPF